MSEQLATPAPVRRARGRPPGAKDKAPRVRRTRVQVQKEGATPPKKLKEGAIQAQFIKWLETVPAPGVPGAKLGHFTFAIPNGIWIPGELQVRIRIIMTMRRQGMKKGIPDVTIALPLHGWHGCFIELKRDKSKMAPSQIEDGQREWLKRLRAAGYFVEMVAGLTDACQAVGRYLSGAQPLPFPWEVSDADAQAG